MKKIFIIIIVAQCVFLGTPGHCCFSAPSAAAVLTTIAHSDLEEAIERPEQVPAVEDKLVAAATKRGTKGFFVIKEIYAIGTGHIKGKICIAGKGSLPVAKDAKERLGEGVVLEWITPIKRGAEINLQKGRAGMLLKDQKLDYSPIYSVGAVWEKIPHLIHKDKDMIDPLNGVAFVSGIRLGALYEGDGNLMFDYVKAGDQVIHFPGGTAGSIHRLVGEITMGKYKFMSEANPL